MAMNDTLFTSDPNGSGGTSSGQYVQDSFSDYSLPATNNTGFSSIATTNPLGRFFANTDTPQFGAKTLFIKDIVLIEDRSLWINNVPTYNVLWTENFPAVQAYAVGNAGVKCTPNGNYVYFNRDAQNLNQPIFGVNGVIRKLAWLLQPFSSTRTMDTYTDGALQTTITVPNIRPLGYQKTNAYSAVLQEATNESYDIHDFRLVPKAPGGIGVEIGSIVGVVVYFENTSSNIDLFPGDTYVNKTKVSTTAGSTLPIPSYGSSLGGAALIYKTSMGCTTAVLGVSFPQTVGVGASGTNLLTVTTGQGASFPAGSGIVGRFGTSFYVGNVLSVSTDTLVVSPTLPFGISGLVDKIWSSSLTTTDISPTYMRKAHSINFNQEDRLTIPYFSDYLADPEMKYVFYASGTTFKQDGVNTYPNSLIFPGLMGEVHLEGAFSALEIEARVQVGNTGLIAVSVNGSSAYSLGIGLTTGRQKITILNDSPSQWNHVSLRPLTAVINIFIEKINFYERAPGAGITYGHLAEIKTQPAVVDRFQGPGQEIFPMGTFKRYFGDELGLKGSGWARTVDAASPANHFVVTGSAANGVTFGFYGRYVQIQGLQGTSTTVSIDGSPTATGFNTLIDAGTENFHALSILHSGQTTTIQSIDVVRAYQEMNPLQSAGPFEALDDPRTSSVIIVNGAHQAAINTNVLSFVDVTILGTSIAYLQDTDNGDRFVFTEDIEATITYTDIVVPGGNLSFGVNVSDSNAGVASLLLTIGDGIVYFSSHTSGDIFTDSFTRKFKRGDTLRVFSETAPTAPAYSYLKIERID